MVVEAVGGQYRLFVKVGRNLPSAHGVARGQLLQGFDPPLGNNSETVGGALHY